jgi:alkane 1-monooxygenase
MILLALVPAAWRRTMDPRVLAHMDGDIRRANISPRHRDRVLARYGAEAGSDDTAQQRTEADDGDRPAPEPGTSSLPGRVRCPGCGYTYDEALGDPREGFPAGTSWAAVPEDWCCPDCGVRDKADFERIERTAA